MYTLIVIMRNGYNTVCLFSPKLALAAQAMAMESQLSGAVYSAVYDPNGTLISTLTRE